MRRCFNRSRTALLACGLWFCAGRVAAHDETLTPPTVIEAAPVVRPSDVEETREVRVLIAVTLDREGHVSAADPISIAPELARPEPFRDAALAYVQSVRFAPALRDGQPVPSSVRFEVLFPALPAPTLTPAPAPTLTPAPSETHAHPALADAHAHPHTHAFIHTHAHAADEPHEHAEFGADAHIARPERAASAYTLDAKDLPRGAHVLPGDLARTVPGMLVIQHAGGGKANQYFLRGFDADHGTDIALSFDGVPINMVSHGHGQGYADLNWIIPELVAGVNVRKGPYDPRDGDFATAGAIDFQTARELPGNRVTVEGGMFHSYRALAIASTRWSALRLTGAAELMGTDGPFKRQEDLKRVNLFGRVAAPLAYGELSVTFTGYLSGWNASGQIPLRAVRAGALDRFGYVDPYEGGSSTRHNLYLRYRSDADRHERWEVLGYLTQYRFALHSDFTFFRDDPIDGDMIHQRDERTLAGFKARYERDDALGPFALTSRFGFDLRHDRIHNGLERAPRREWETPIVAAQISESALAAYLEEEVEWLRWLRTTAGVRSDVFGFAVDDALEDRTTLGSKTSGERLAARVNPKASLVLAPLSWLSLYANYGMGYHSNDARGVMRGVTPLTRADGYEVGLSLKLLGHVRLRAALFRLDLASELVWVGDEGTTEASGRTRREGLETDVRVDILPWLWADASLTLARAHFVHAPSSADEVPLAPRRLFTGKLTAAHPRGPFGRLSVIALGDRPATEDGVLVAQGFSRVDLSLGYQHPRFELALALENLLNTAWRESQFANVSRLPNETAPEACTNGSRAVTDGGTFVGCEDMHFTPGTPFAVRASASVKF